MPPVGFEPTIPASERPLNYALDRAAAGTGTVINYIIVFIPFIIIIIIIIVIVIILNLLLLSTHHKVGKRFLYFLISSFRRVLYVVCFPLGNYPASGVYMPTFRNTLSVPSS